MQVKVIRNNFLFSFLLFLFNIIVPVELHVYIQPVLANAQNTKTLTSTYFSGLLCSKTGIRMSRPRQGSHHRSSS